LTLPPFPFGAVSPRLKASSRRLPFHHKSKPLAAWSASSATAPCNDLNLMSEFQGLDFICQTRRRSSSQILIRPALFFLQFLRPLFKRPTTPFPDFAGVDAFFLLARTSTFPSPCSALFLETSFMCFYEFSVYFLPIVWYLRLWTLCCLLFPLFHFPVSC